MSEFGFEFDKTNSGKVKINVISVANLVALLGLLGIAAGTWNTLTSRVDVLSTKVDFFQQAILERNNMTRELSSKVEVMGNRLTAMETVLQRVERKLESSPR